MVLGGRTKAAPINGQNQALLGIDYDAGHQADGNSPASHRLMQSRAALIEGFPQQIYEAIPCG